MPRQPKRRPKKDAAELSPAAADVEAPPAGEPTDEPAGKPNGVESAVETLSEAPAQGAAPVVESESSEASMAAELEAARQEAAEHYDRFVRTQAELQNVLKRHERERGERIKYAAEALGRDLLDVVDDLDRALEHAAATNDGLIEGVRLVQGGLLAVLQRHGVERIEAAGRPFDPAEHEAVITVETDAHEPNVVIDEHRAGYRLHDRLLRAAMVSVSKAPSPEPDAAKGADGETGGDESADK